MKKYLKFSLLGLFAAVTFTSCLKSREDAGGLLDDKGGIITTIGEAAYINTDAQNVGLGYSAWANVNLDVASRATESVKFFTIHVAQNRDVKVSGNMIVTVKMTDIGTTPLPAGAISFNPNITVPAFTGISTDVPVYYTINKSVFTPAMVSSGQFAINFEITAVSQGVFSSLEKSVDVGFNTNYVDIRNNTDMIGRYKWVSTVTDPTGQFTITNNTKAVALVQDGVPTAPALYIEDLLLASPNVGYPFSEFLFANRQIDGKNTGLIVPYYTLNTAGQITGISNVAGAAQNYSSPFLETIAPARISNLTLDPTGENKFTYIANDKRTMNVKYSFTLTYPINGVDVARTIKVTESFTYDYIQANYAP